LKSCPFNEGPEDDLLFISRIHRDKGVKSGLAFIEIEQGDYLGEDDIERLEDKYVRT